MDYKILIRWLLTENQGIIENAQINVESQRFTYVGAQKKADSLPDAEVIDYSSKGLAVPPFINAHTHLPETLIRGICDDKSLFVWLFEHVWKVEPSMTASNAKTGALLGIAEMISSGTIGFVDQYFYSNKIAEAVFESGVKAYLAPSIFGEDTINFNPESNTVEEGFNQNIKVFDRWHKRDNRIFVGLGAHAPYTVSEDWLEKIIFATKERDTKLHIHLNETKQEIIDAQKTWNCSPIELMDQLDALSNVYAAHCVHTSEKDRNLLAYYQTPVLSCPQSNLKTAAGIAPLPDYVNQNIPVTLGTDGSASNNNLDMLEEVRLTALIHKGLRHDPTIFDANSVLKLVTRNSSILFPDNAYSGVIRENSLADLAIISLNHVNTTPIINPLSNWIFASYGSNVALTMANGKILYQNGIFFTINIEKVKQEAQQAIEDMIDRSDYELDKVTN